MHSVDAMPHPCIIILLTVASGASTTPAGLPRWGPRFALGFVYCAHTRLSFLVSVGTALSPQTDSLPIVDTIAIGRTIVLSLPSSS
jgi:hypothetical protein